MFGFCRMTDYYERCNIMARKFPFAIWNYNIFGDFKPEEVDVWAECGLTVTLTERITYGKDDLKDLIPFLDRAEEKGIMLIANVNGLTNGDVLSLTDEEYEKRFAEVYALYKGHPALYGFYVGDEPSSKSDYDASARCIRIQKKVAPELRPYINFQGSSCFHDPACFDGRSFVEWLYELNAETGFADFSFSQYEQVAGRAGRGDKKGRVVVQTYCPEEPASVLASQHDYPAFYAQEIKRRELGDFPPFARFIRFLFVDEDEKKCRTYAERFAGELQKLLEEEEFEESLLHFSCSPSSIAKIEQKYRWQVLIKLNENLDTDSLVEKLMDFDNAYDHGSVIPTMEINPRSMI